MSTKRKRAILVTGPVILAAVVVLVLWVQNSDFVARDACLDSGGAWQGTGPCVFREEDLAKNRRP